MVQLLGSALDLPLEERNPLHVAAGFVPPYGDRGLAAENLQPVRQALDFILRQQEPYPGIVIDGRWLRSDVARNVRIPSDLLGGEARGSCNGERDDRSANKDGLGHLWFRTRPQRLG